MIVSKGGQKMAKRTFGTSIDEKVIQGFKVACAKNNIPMNTVMEIFMKAYAEGRFKTEIQYESQSEEK